jgi:hypothetical protein
MKKLYTIEMLDKSDNEKDVIGVASALDYVPIMISDYIGFNNYKINRKHDIEESGLEYVLYITVFKDEISEEYEAEIIVRYFTVNVV